jgi:hypothetical protein
MVVLVLAKMHDLLETALTARVSGSNRTNSGGSSGLRRRLPAMLRLA